MPSASADPHGRSRLERLVMISDGVFAIAVTLMAIEIRPPEGWDRTAIGLWRELWPVLSAYAVSFVAIAAYWISHHRAFSHYQRADATLTVLNFLVLALIALVPAGTRLIYETGPRGEPLQIYIGLIAAVGVANALQWGYAAFVGGLVDPRVPTAFRIVIFLIQLLVPGAMATLGVYTARPGLAGYALGAMIALAVVVAMARRWVGRMLPQT